MTARHLAPRRRRFRSSVAAIAAIAILGSLFATVNPASSTADTAPAADPHAAGTPRAISYDSTVTIDLANGRTGTFNVDYGTSKSYWVAVSSMVEPVKFVFGNPRSPQYYCDPEPTALPATGGQGYGPTGSATQLFCGVAIGRAPGPVALGKFSFPVTVPAGVSAGTYSFNMMDGTDGSNRKITVRVVGQASPPSILTSSLADGHIGVPYSAELSATGGPVTEWSATPLPSGLQIDSSTGQIRGTPTASGTTAVRVTAQGPGGSDSKTLNLTVVGARPTITTPSLPAGLVGHPYTAQLAADGDVTSWTIAGPAWLSIDGTTGKLSGTPTARDTQTVVVEASGPGGSDTKTFDLRTFQPVTITSPSDGGTVLSNRPVISGRGEPGETVTVKRGSTAVGSAVVGSTGSWSVRSTVSMPDGPVTVTATQTVDGVTTSADGSFTVWNPLSITAPTDKEVVRTSTPVISGTGVDGSIVEIYDEQGRNLLGDGKYTVPSKGEWSKRSLVALADGEHTITVTHRSGSQTAEVTRTFTVKTAAAVTITSPAEGSKASSNRPTVSGKGEPGETVTVKRSSTQLGSAVVGSNGSWSVRSTVSMPDGPVTVTATQTVDGVTTSADRSFTVWNPLSITAPADKEVVRTSTPVISGTGVDGSIVEIYDEQGRNLLGDGKYTVPSKGVWSKRSLVALADGEHTITVTHLGGSQTAEVTRTFTVKTAAAVTITSPASGSTVWSNRPTITGTGEPGETVTVAIGAKQLGSAIVLESGTWSLSTTADLSRGQLTVTATQNVDGVISSADRSFTVRQSAAFTTPENTVLSRVSGTISGIGEPGAKVTLGWDNFNTANVYGTGNVDSQGEWSVTLSRPIPAGPHPMVVKQDLGGTQVRRMYQFAKNVAITSPSDNATVPVRPTISGNGEPNTTVTVTLDAPDGLVIGTARVDAAGHWQLVSTGALGAGEHLLIAQDSLDSEARVTVQVQRAPQSQIVVTPLTRMVAVLPSYPAPKHVREGSR